MIRSALMTSAHQDVDKEDGTTPADPFDFGAGHIRPNPATDPGLVYDTGLLDYAAFLCGAGALDVAACTTPPPVGFGVQPNDPSDLNLPSIGIDGLTGVQTVTREVTNAGSAGTYSVTGESPPGIDVAVSPSSLTLGAGETGTYEVTFTTTAGAVFDQWAFGSLTWSDAGGHAVLSPVAIRPVALAAPDAFTGTGTSGSASWEVTFGYTGPFAAEPLGLVPPSTEAGTVVDDPANDIDVALASGVGITEHLVPVAAGTEHLRVSLFDEFTDGEDDLDLYLFDPAGDFVDSSGDLTSAEQIDVARPVTGDWKVVVHGWQTDGPDAGYTLFTWRVPGTGAGNLAVTAPATAIAGQQGPIGISWTGLTAGTRYLGAVRYSDTSSEIDRTLVEIAG